jgi:hypothetical protein
MGMYSYWQSAADKICDEFVAGKIVRPDARRRLQTLGVNDPDEWLQAALDERTTPTSAE